MSDQPALDMGSLKKRMEGALATLKGEFQGLRTGRASASLVEHVMVDAYGTMMPLHQVATVSVPEPRMITVQVWDRSMVAAVDKAIRSAGLGLNPSTEGQLIRLPIPPLTQERRAELAKIAAKYAEQGRVAVRNVRRDGIEQLRAIEKKGGIGKDEAKRLQDDVQALTDRFVGEIDGALKAKEAEIMQV